MTPNPKLTQDLSPEQRIQMVRILVAAIICITALGIIGVLGALLIVTGGLS